MVQPQSAGVGALVKDIGRDLRAIARDEVWLARREIAASARLVAVEAAMLVCGATVALIGFAWLSVAAVTGLAPVVSSLTARVLIVATVYLGIGGTLATVFALKLRHDVVPPLREPLDRARDVAKSIKDGVLH